MQKSRTVVGIIVMNQFEVATIVVGAMGVVIFTVLMPVVCVYSMVSQLVVRISKVAACNSQLSVYTA